MKLYSKSLVSTIALLACWGAASVSSAEEAAKSASASHVTEIGEVVVTAQKRSESIRDVPLSVSALGKADLAAVGHADVTALVNRIPGLQVQEFSPTTVVFNLRGVSQNNFADSQEAPIAFYNDEVYTAALSAISGQNFDLARIEVLKGPQGTLFGRNATGGLVQYITAKPTASFEASAALTLGSYGEVGSDGYVSGPLSDHVRARLSFDSDRYDGYIKNVPQAFDPSLAGQPNLGNRDFYAGRAQIEADIGATGLLRLKAQFLHDGKEWGAPYSWGASTTDPVYGTGVPNPGGKDFYGYQNPSSSPFVQEFGQPFPFTRDAYTLTARYEQDIVDGIHLISITDYQHVQKSYGEDTSMTPFFGFLYFQNQRQWQASQEFRISKSTDKLNWVAGVYGLLVNGDAQQSVYTNNMFLVPPDQAAIFQEGSSLQKTQSGAIFGQLDYKITPTLTATVGARYSYDRKRDFYTHLVGATMQGPLAIDTVFNPGNNPLATQIYQNWSGKVGLEYRPERDMLFYASYNRGTKSGGFDIPIFLYNLADMPYKQEVLTNYEAGSKVSFLDRKLDLSGAIFHYDYKNYQAFIIADTSTVIKNLPAEETGFELEANAHPVDGLRVGLFWTHLSTVVHNVALPSPTPTPLIVNRKLPDAPTDSIGWSGTYKAPIGSNSVSLSTDWRWDSAYYQTTYNDVTGREAPHLVGNVQLQYDTEKWSLGLHINNVTNKRYRVYVIDNSSLEGSYNSTYALPRWFGATFTARY